jgi:signal transduction histidine kinase
MSERILDQRAFKRFLFRSVVWPIMLMAGLCIVLVWQIKSLINASALVARSDVALAQLNQLEEDQIDLETGVRGYLITGELSFLEPYEHAKADIAQTSTKLEASLFDPEEKKRLQDVAMLRGQWLAYAENLIAIRQGKTPGNWQSVAVARQGKAIMDRIRGEFQEIIQKEEQLRIDRDELARKGVTFSVIVTCAAALLVGGFFSFLSKRQLEYLSRVYESALTEMEQLNASLEQRVNDRTAELADANKSLGDVNTELEAFAYSISHDLRAPMRHITGFAELLRTSTDAKLTADDKENLGIIQDTARVAGRMVDDLLALSRVGRVQLTMMTVKMGSLVEQCRRDLQLDTQQRTIEWTVGPLPDAYGDPALLKLALQNLISNAVKYTAGRDVAKIEVGATPQGSGTTYFIRDNGVGFDMEYVHKLFGVFQRLHRAEEFEGTGIGLANARRIIVRHGGRIWAEAAKGQGAMFSFWLPNEKPELGSSHE